MENNTKSYLRFFAMIGTSMLFMYIFMYLNTYAMSDVRFSETRFYMTLIMGASMAVIMLSFMLGMYKNKTINLAICGGSLALFVLAIFLVRSQSLVDDRSYMKGMIPHHSIAILTSERAQIEDIRVRKLANDIISAQKREILEMDWLNNDISKNGPALSEEEARNRPIPDFTAKDYPHQE